MSMSQEEIESLMNGIDIGDDEAATEATEESSPDEASVTMSEDDIASLIAETDEIKADENSSETEISEEAVSEILNEIPDNSSEEEISEKDIDDLLGEVEGLAAVNEEAVIEEETQDVSTTDIDELMASIDSMEEDEPTEVTNDALDLENLTVDPTNEESSALESQEEVALSEDNSSKELANDDIEDILAQLEEEGSISEESSSPDIDLSDNAISLPSDKNTKVVNQLSQVAHDSEEKAVKILDVLSSVMDDNDESIKHLNKFDTFIQSQVTLLETLTQKFPNVEEFSNNLEMVNQLKDEPAELMTKLKSENDNLLSAMELMQYHDINRQKIERVMSVIRKLSLYLNDIFEDSEEHATSTPVAKHIHGDDSSDLIGNDDLESLISEFGN